MGKDKIGKTLAKGWKSLSDAQYGSKMRKAAKKDLEKSEAD